MCTLAQQSDNVSSEQHEDVIDIRPTANLDDALCSLMLKSGNKFAIKFLRRWLDQLEQNFGDDVNVNVNVNEEVDEYNNFLLLATSLKHFSADESSLDKFAQEKNLTPRERILVETILGISSDLRMLALRSHLEGLPVFRIRNAVNRAMYSVRNTNNTAS